MAILRAILKHPIFPSQYSPVIGTLKHFRKLMEIFPSAKVILTKHPRDQEGWYNSVRGTIYQMSLDVNKFPLNILTKLDGSSVFHSMVNNLMKDGSKDGKCSEIRDMLYRL